MPKKIGSLTLYSVDELHEKLGLSKMTIRTYLREGRIRGRKLGVSWYVTEEALREYFGDSGSQSEESTEETKRNRQNFKYVVQGVNDLVSEKEECETAQEAVECLENQAIVSLFQVALVNRDSNEIVELIKARDFLDRYA